MSPLSSGTIRGNWATLIIPIQAGGSIDFRALETEIDQLISFHPDGIYSNGTAGEFYNQTEEEFDRISELLAAKCRRSGTAFQLGCSHMSPMTSLQRVKRAVPLAPGAIQVILPDWYPPSMAEIIDFLRVIGDAARPIGLVLYNPPHAKKRLDPQDYGEIIRSGVPVIGCKTAGGNENWYKEMKTYSDNLSLFVPGHTLASGYILGAHGAYSNVACLHPGAAQRWYECMKTDPDSALELETRIRRFMGDHIIPFITREGYSNQAVDKLLVAIGGWSDLSPRLRWPYRSISADAVPFLHKAARNLIPEFFPEG